MQKEIKQVSVAKSLDMEKRRATFVVLEPQPEDGTTTDLHGDWYSEEDIVEGCYSFNKHCRKANLLHLIDTNGFQFIESYILPSEAIIGETKVKKGSWVATIEVEDSEQYEWIWEGIKDGTFNGLSIQCDAYEQPMET